MERKEKIGQYGYFMNCCTKLSKLRVIDRKFRSMLLMCAIVKFHVWQNTSKNCTEVRAARATQLFLKLGEMFFKKTFHQV